MNTKHTRQTVWEKTCANFALEGIHPSEEMERIGKLYIEGKISLEQQGDMMKQSILSEAEIARRRNAWERAVVSSALEGLERDPKQDEYMEAYFKGERSKAETLEGLQRMAKGLLP